MVQEPCPLLALRLSLPCQEHSLSTCFVSGPWLDSGETETSKNDQRLGETSKGVLRERDRYVERIQPCLLCLQQTQLPKYHRCL